MELVEVICNAHFSDTRIGAVSRKQVLKIPLQIAKELQSLDLVTIKNPPAAVLQASSQIEEKRDGGAEPLQSSQEARASISETLRLSRRGKPKRAG